MLRSAEEILKETDDSEFYTSYEDKKGVYYNKNIIIKSVNIARKEALEEARLYMGTDFDKAIMDKLISEIK